MVRITAIGQNFVACIWSPSVHFDVNVEKKLRVPLKKSFTGLVTCCAKLLEFNWLQGMQLIRNCTGQIRAKICNRDLIGCCCRAKSCSCYLISYFCRAKSCNSP